MSNTPRMWGNNLNHGREAKLTQRNKKNDLIMTRRPIEPPKDLALNNFSNVAMV
jgi:hypothetical protein